MLGLRGGTEFVTTWRTTTASETITIPTVGTGYNYDIVTSDGQTFTGETGDKTITFATAGDYDVRISGDFPRIYFNNGGDKDKLIDIKQWGNIAWTSMSAAFYGCSNLVGSFTDAPDLSSVTNMSLMFYGASSFNQNIGSWDVSSVNNMYGMFYGASSFNQPLNWDVSNVTSMSRMFYSASSFDQPIGNWDVSSVTNMSDMFRWATSFNQPLNWDVSSVTNMFAMFNSVTLSTTNYDSILVDWEAYLQAAFPGGTGYTPTISISFGGSKYTLGSAAATARQSLIDNFNWTIVDGGGI